MVMGISSIVYFVRNVAQSFESSLFAAFQFGAVFSVLYTICTALLSRNKLIEFFSEFQIFYDKCE